MKLLQPTTGHRKFSWQPLEYGQSSSAQSLPLQWSATLQSRYTIKAVVRDCHNDNNAPCSTKGPLSMFTAQGASSRFKRNKNSFMAFPIPSLVRYYGLLLSMTVTTGTVRVKSARPFKARCNQAFNTKL